jgi:crotonobetainyl-CoA:carnitine CoA-transferase CaiB-like acyl-CoA transferase
MGRAHRAVQVTQQTQPPLPLEGIRVLDLSQIIAGPYCCMMLGDMGADVIKIEPPGIGDLSRKWGHLMKGADHTGFMTLNRNKRSIVLDLKQQHDREVLYALIDSADVLVENGRPGVAKRLGYGYAEASARNPRLVYASISGFGQNGPWADRPGFDLIAQAMSGLMSVTGYPGQAPAKVGVPISDIGSAMFAVYAILSALIGRGRTGQGQHIDAALFDAALGFSIWEASDFWATNMAPGPIGTASRMSAPYQAFRTADGYVAIGAGNDRLWQLLCQAIEREDLLGDPRFPDMATRLANLQALVDELEQTFGTRSTADWVKRLLDAGVPAGPINDYAQSLTSEHAQARDMVMPISHPVEGEIRSLGFPVKMSGTPQQLRYPPPRLGEHTDEILAELGLSERAATVKRATS